MFEEKLSRAKGVKSVLSNPRNRRLTNIQTSSNTLKSGNLCVIQQSSAQYQQVPKKVRIIAEKGYV